MRFLLEASLINPMGNYWSNARFRKKRVCYTTDIFPSRWSLLVFRLAVTRTGLCSPSFGMLISAVRQKTTLHALHDLHAKLVRVNMFPQHIHGDRPLRPPSPARTECSSSACHPHSYSTVRRRVPTAAWSSQPECPHRACRLPTGSPPPHSIW